MRTPDTRFPAEHVPAIASLLAGERFSNGERAALKRMGLDGPAPLALHRIILSLVDKSWQSKHWLTNWRTLVCALAIQRDCGINSATTFGQALADAQYAENRLERLLSASGDTLRVLTLRAARQIAAKGIACDWGQLAELIFSDNSESRENINIRIARDYYRTLQAFNLKE